jgi:hypothetical protein
MKRSKKHKLRRWVGGTLAIIGLIVLLPAIVFLLPANALLEPEWEGE